MKKVYQQMLCRQPAFAPEMMPSAQQNSSTAISVPVRSHCRRVDTIQYPGVTDVTRPARGVNRAYKVADLPGQVRASRIMENDLRV